MVDDFIERHIESIKDYNNHSETGIKSNTKYNLIRIIFFLYVVSLIGFLISTFFKFNTIQIILLTCTFLFLAALFFTDYLDKSELQKLQKKRRLHFINTYSTNLILYRSISDSICECDKNTMALKISDAKQIKELSLMIKDVSNKSRKKYKLNFALLSLGMTALIAFINFSKIDGALYLYFLSSFLIIFLFIFFSLLYRLLERIVNKKSFCLDELVYILNEIHLLFLLEEQNSESKTEEMLNI